MKKMFILLLFFSLLALPTVFAINLDLEKQSLNEVLVLDTGKPVIFDLKITNNGAADNFEFYNLLGFSMFPVGTISIGSGATKDVSLGLVPLGEIKERGFYTFSYFIRGTDTGQQQETLTFNIVEIGDAIIIGSGDVDPESGSIEVFIRNRVNFDFEVVDVEFSSAFFDFEESFSLGPNERRNFTVQLNQEDFKQLGAGFYTLVANIDTGTVDGRVEGVIKFVEKDLVTTTRKNYGFFINTQVIEKKNEGNTVESSETVVKKNILSRLFTSFSPEPDVVEREGGTIFYSWIRDVGPGETLEIRVKTNWIFPFVVILFIVAIVILAKKYKGTNLVLKKRVSFVKAKGGEFALKVSILLNAKNYVERVNVIDRLPPLVKIYERFGGDEPTRIDHKNRRLEWNFEKLEAGETRVISYIIYSKIGVIGKFALPTATAVFEREGVIHESESNRAFFVAEQRKKDIED
ncbi:MAG TPA: hypothetical protein ENH99_00095 [Candidatus Pacearchaeota archaeon]|nr:hypothetical protein [Candidatus Pacearchaeota archaeon]